jgi:hypothetical protein
MDADKSVTAGFQQLSVEFAVITSSGSEEINLVTLAVELTAACSHTVTVDYSVSGGTATGSGVDYTLASGTLSFSPGDTSENVQITVVDDSVVEGNETVIIMLSSPVNATLGANTSYTYTIICDDDNTPPAISGLIPDANSIQVARDIINQLHVTDSGSGVEYDGGTATIHVEGDLIYDGANENPEGVYDSTGNRQIVRGVCTRTGTPADYTFVFQPSTSFDYEQKVDVVVTAADKAGNNMTETYYFYTEMRSFAANTKVNSDTAMLAQNRPATAVDSAGNIWVVWDQTTASADTDIYIGEFKMNGSDFEPSVPVLSNVDNHRNPAIAIDNSDKIYVAWEGADSTGKWDIFVSTSTNGTNWSNPVQINTGDPNNESDQTSPEIAIDGSNRAYVTWVDERSGNKDIWVATSIDATIWSNTQVTTNNSDQSEPAIAIDASNIAYVVWADRRNASTTGGDIYGADSSTGPWNNVPLINIASNQSSPACAASGGVLHLLWIDDADANGSVFYASVTGGLQGGTVVIDPDVVDEPAYGQTNPAIAVQGTGISTKIFTCWRDSRWINNGDEADIYFAETVSSFGTNILVNDDAVGNPQVKPDIGIDKDGNPYIVWVDNRNNNNDIYYAGATPISGLETTIIDDSSKVTVEASTVANLQVIIPAGALPDRVDANNITIAEVSNLPAMPAECGGFGMQYKFGPSGLHFNSPVTIRIPHLEADCLGHSVHRVYRYDPSSLTFWSEEGIHNPATHSPSGATPHYLEVQVDHFSAFGAGGGNGGGGGGGGGGCSMSSPPHGPRSVVEFLLPYIVFVIVLLMISRIDARRRRKETVG